MKNFMKNVQKPNLVNTISHAIGLADGFIGLLTLGAYCPYWQFDYIRYRIDRDSRKIKQARSDESL